MIDWLTKQISKYESHLNNNNNKEVKESKQEEKEEGEEELGRENTRDYIRKNGGRIHYIDDY
jgi:hypothetical protein